MNMHKSPIIPMIIRGEAIETDLVEFSGRRGGLTFRTPDSHKYVKCLPMTNRRGLKDLHDLSTDEVLDFLSALGEQLEIDKNAYLQEARSVSYSTAPTPPSIVDAEYAALARLFDRKTLADTIEQERPYLDGWVPRRLADGRTISIRAFGARCLHITAGNSPLISALSIIRGALARGDGIIKSPSNDPFTAAALLRTMIDLDPKHPVTKHFSVAYWRGGDEDFERRLYLPHNIEKVLAWGGFASVKHVAKYIQPGLELISFDPKRSCSVIGAEAFQSEKGMKDAAARVAMDIGQLNQVACTNARTVFLLTGTDPKGIEKANRFGRLAYDAMMALPEHLSTKPLSCNRELRSHIEASRPLDEWYNVIGGTRGEGAIIVSQIPETVEFAPMLNDRVANFVPVDNILDIDRFLDAYTQTVGVYPEALKLEIRDVFPLLGAQRFATLGFALDAALAGPQDGIEPLRRMCKWIVDENCDAACRPILAKQREEDATA
jgi:hypothetical protein